MRNFFIESLETLVSVLVAVLGLLVLIASIATMFSADGGFFSGIGMLIFGGAYVILTAGVLYLFLGIQENTKRTADAVEKLLAK
ncbi:hypothetical protein Ga0609869_001169 [Rhodovulum iodosum]|uniref:Uncharacterized protein n=1 Tax=Rhodovulum iodosum TaxID=68291 RepID=A0ABV3XR59_9RHOB|nr:hypothetical protein [Rhodovulum robiginosum]RSK32768.1 hypothetical protein EJA01_10545 [Rhodovulum robiginosum]